SETVVAKGMLQAIRLRRRYMEHSCQTVPPHVEAAVKQVTRLRRASEMTQLDDRQKRSQQFQFHSAWLSFRSNHSFY
ncbi:MAG: hypothetical protein OSB38_33780, partial [Paraburkholderia fungorum]|nr:hypothetical protein [Paraburkholderia fungorum]